MVRWVAVLSGSVGAFAFLVAGLLCASLSPPAASPKVAAEWLFHRADDVAMWQPNAQIVDAAVTPEGLTFRTVGYDPILELGPLLDLPASPWHTVEIRLKSDRDGTAELFWSNTTEPPYGGFRPHKRMPFWVTGDGQWHTYRLLPFWHPEGKLVRLRFDPFGNANFTLASIRIVELPVAKMSPATEQVREWLLIGDGELKPTQRGWTVSLKSPDAFLLTPAAIDSEQRFFVSIRMAVTAGKIATFFFASEQLHGLHSYAFPVVADGREHTYTLELLSSPNWRGRIIAIGLRPSDTVNATATVREVRFSAEPQGVPEVKVVAFALDDATPRAGVPTELFALVRHAGGEPARRLHPILRLPKGVEVLSQPEPVDTLELTGSFMSRATTRFRS